MDKRYLFICGCPRSGTAAMWDVLTAHPDIVLGIEWFAARAADLTPELFERERFFNPVQGEDCGINVRAHARSQTRFAAMVDRFDSALFVGDKIPFLFRYLDSVGRTFPGATIVWMLRDIYEVAASYKKRDTDPNDVAWGSGGVRDAVAHVNEALTRLLQPPAGVDIIVVHYERMFRETGGAFSLAARLGLSAGPIADELERKRIEGYDLAASRPPALSAGDLRHIAEQFRFDLWREVKRRYGSAPAYGPISASAAQ